MFHQLTRRSRYCEKSVNVDMMCRPLCLVEISSPFLGSPRPSKYQRHDVLVSVVLMVSYVGIVKQWGDVLMVWKDVVNISKLFTRRLAD